MSEPTIEQLAQRYINRVEQFFVERAHYDDSENADDAARVGNASSAMHEAGEALRKALSATEVRSCIARVADIAKQRDELDAALATKEQQLVRASKDRDFFHQNASQWAEVAAELESERDQLRAQLAEKTQECDRLREDAARLDWLETMAVNVRIPLLNGSRCLFWASPDDLDGMQERSEIRARIDSARKEGA